jgi:branched-chain amino acid aminotransferase
MAKQNSMPFAFFHKKILPFEEAKISISSHSVQYGTTCFGGIRGYIKPGITPVAQVFRLYDHYLRLMNATKILGMRVSIAWEEFEEIIIKLIQANVPETDFYIRPFFYSEDQILTPCFDEIDFKLAVYMTPLGYYFDPLKGLRLMISSWRKVSDHAIPTKAKVGGFYVNSALAKSEAKQNGYDDALMMDEQGNIVEASAANLFIVSRGEIFMPETGAAMLEGITRRTVIEFLEEEDIKVRLERIDRSMIYTCDELILTGTAAQVVFAESVDGRILAPNGKPGAICQLLQQKFENTLNGKHPKSPLWLTNINIDRRS